MRKDLNILDFLAQIPWWVSVSLSGSFYLLLKFVVPYFEAQSSLVHEVQASIGLTLAPVVALALLTPVTFSVFRPKRKKKLQGFKEEIHSIQEMPWQAFKEIVADSYRQTGYLILDNDLFAADPGVDIIMRKSANLYLVQCRYWRNRRIGLREVKKLNSLLHDKQASGAFLLTTGLFTNKARRYAVGRPINLVDGSELMELLGKDNTDSATTILS